MLVNEKADSESRELPAEDIYATFKAEYLEKNDPLKLISYDTSKEPGQEEITCIAKIQINGEEKELTGKGNGPINAFVHALEQQGLKDFKLTDYRQHSIGEGSATESAAYVQLQTKVGRVAYGCGIDSSIEKSGLLALVSGFNRTRSRIIGQDSIAKKKDFWIKFNESGTFLVIARYKPTQTAMPDLPHASTSFECYTTIDMVRSRITLKLVLIGIPGKWLDWSMMTIIFPLFTGEIEDREDRRDDMMVILEISTKWGRPENRIWSHSHRSLSSLCHL